MKRKMSIYSIVAACVMLLAAVALFNPANVLGQATIPSRTPTPRPGATDPPPRATDPPPPTDDRPGGGGGGGGPRPSNTPGPQFTATVRNTLVAPATSTVVSAVSSATSTAQPTNTLVPSPAASATETAPATGDATETATPFLIPIDSNVAFGTTPIPFPIVATAFPTAETCGEPPTFVTLTTANAYGGPGSNYELVETLDADEVRPIVGRAGYSTWWLIQLDGKYNQAWISDRAGTVQGYTGSVPVIAAPDLDGLPPTPGDPWAPTPAPVCTPTVMPTISAALGIEETNNSVAAAGSVEGVSDNSSSDSNSAELSGESADQRNQIAATAPPLDIPATTPTPNLLPIAGLVLVIGAVFVALFLRRSPEP